MKQITIFESQRYAADAICRILQDEPEYQVQAILKGQKDNGSILAKTDILVYSTHDCTDEFLHELKTVQQTYPAIKYVLIINCIHKRLLQRIHNTGVQVIISHKSSAEELFIAVDAALNVRKFMSEDIGQIVVKNILSGPINELSNREFEITCMLANGVNIQRVSSLLNISPKTVSTYRSRIFSKLSISGNMQLFQFVNKEAAYLLAS